MKKSCFLFGHADTPRSVLPILQQTIEDQIAKGVSVFYVGYHGSFDRMAADVLRAAKYNDADIRNILVLSYHPAEQAITLPEGFDETYYPPLEGIPRRYAIVRANQYMVKKVDSLICYVRHHGNAKNLLEYAKKNHTHKNSIINIADEGFAEE